MKKALHIFSSAVVFIIIIVMLLIAGVRIIGIDTYNYSDNSVLYVKPITDYSQIEVGDTITYRLNTDNSIATNTVYSVNSEKRFFYIKASELSYNFNDQKIPDSAILVDNVPVVPVSFDSLIGKVVAALPYMGYVSDFLAERTGFTIVMAVMAFFIIMLLVTAPHKRTKNTTDEELLSEADDIDTTVPEVVVPKEAVANKNESKTSIQKEDAPQKKFSRTVNLSEAVKSDSAEYDPTTASSHKKYSRTFDKKTEK